MIDARDDPFGVRDLDTSEPMRPEDIFHMASVSKPFVATAVVQLAERGLIELDEWLSPLAESGCGLPWRKAAGA